MPRPIIAQPEESSSRVDFVGATEELACSRASKGYVARRWALVGSSDGHDVEMGTVSQLSLGEQIAFHQTMLSLLALQLLVVCTITSVFRFVPHAQHVSVTLFDPIAERLAAASSAALVLLLVLYFSRSVCLLKWLLLALFTVAECAVLVGFGVVLDSSICVFNCAFSLACVVVMIAMAGGQRRPVSRETVLPSSLTTGTLAFLTVGLAACCLFAAYGDAIATSRAFCVTLGLQAALSLWLAFDAATMHRVLTSDECSDAVVLFYSDLVLLLLILTALVVVIACASFCACGGSDCDCDCDPLPVCLGCNCSGCDPDVFGTRDQALA